MADENDPTDPPADPPSASGPDATPPRPDGSAPEGPAQFEASPVEPDTPPGAPETPATSELPHNYFRAAGDAYALVSIGLISFAAVAQFAPALFGALYWQGGTKQGAIAGLLAGFAVWGYTLLLPSLATAGWLSPHFLQDGLFSIALLKPHALLGLRGLDAISHSVFWSMLANISAYVGVSLAGRPGVVETAQARLFVDVFRRTAPGDGAGVWQGRVPVADLLPLLSRFWRNL